MTVYVDNMRAPYGRLIMCHLLSDTSDEELHAMADAIGVSRRWWQRPPKVSTSHYDICLSKRALAVEAGAIEITLREAGILSAYRRATGEFGPLGAAKAWHEARKRQKALPGSPEQVSS